MVVAPGKAVTLNEGRLGSWILGRVIGIIWEALSPDWDAPVDNPEEPDEEPEDPELELYEYVVVVVVVFPPETQFPPESVDPGKQLWHAPV